MAFNQQGIFRFGLLADFPVPGDDRFFYIDSSNFNWYAWDQSVPDYVLVIDGQAALGNILWGNISGTITSQTDLINYFVDKTTNQTVAGQKTFTDTLIVLLSAVVGAEIEQSWRTADSNSRMRVVNGSATNGVFVPKMDTFQETSGQAAFIWDITSADAIDTGSTTIHFLLRLMNQSGSALANRIPMQIRIGTTTVALTLMPNGNIGLGTTTAPTEKFEVPGNIRMNGFFTSPPKAISSPTTVTTSDFTIEITSGTFTQPLPSASGIGGRIYIFVNMGSGIITLDPNGSETIQGAATYQLKKQYDFVQIQSNGANWLVIG